MFDYNFPEQLTMKRQIILLLSMVIPTDPDIHPLKEMYTEELVHPAPSGISVINHLFRRWGIHKYGSIYFQYDGDDDGKLKLVRNHNRHYIELNEKISRFRRCVELFKNADYTGLENELDDVDDIEQIGDINSRLGIQVDIHRRIECN